MTPLALVTETTARRLLAVLAEVPGAAIVGEVKCSSTMYDGRLNHDLMQARVVIRRAFRSDQAAITALVHSENLARDDLDWRRFVVALAHGRVIGAVQMRRHADGSQELASLVVAPQFRGRGLAAQLITTLLAQHASPVQMITGARFARRYARFGFQRVPQWRAPRGHFRRTWKWLSWP